eukprot:GFUD01007645.1.p1 GENE.GFUD01007645.1~~GFUD01007645.1.p1  ORF type:complete len:318 (+),score=91.98 GFUD01007645.1:69-956(+)
MDNQLEKVKTDSNHNNLPTEISSKLDLTSLPSAVKEGKFADIKLVVESGADLDEVDEDGNTALHVAVLGGQYNTAVLLLNRGCSLATKNAEGLTGLQMAQSMEGRTVFAMAIQLTEKSRVDRGKKEEKQRLVQEEKLRELTEDMDTLDSGEEEEKDSLKMSSKLMASQYNLASAKKLVSDLEDQVKAAKFLVNNLERDVTFLHSEFEQSKRSKKKKKKNKSQDQISGVVFDHCSVCLDVPKPPTKVFQCPEGHIFCETCKMRPEMTCCPECRVSLAGIEIRNRTLEKLILLSTKS